MKQPQRRPKNGGPEEDDPAGNVTMFVVRHASAGRRDESDPADAERSLDTKGFAQADRLSDVLAHKQVGLIAASPLIRCVQTVDPLARTIGLDVSIEVRFAEMTPVEDAWAALETAVRTAAHNIEGRRSAVVCSHGDIIPDLLRIATLRGTRVIGRSGNAKGAVWELSGWNGSTFATARYQAQEDFVTDGSLPD